MQASLSGSLEYGSVTSDFVDRIHQLLSSSAAVVLYSRPVHWIADPTEKNMDRNSSLAVSILVAVSISSAFAQESKDAKIKRAMSAGPPSIAKDAKIVDMDEKGNMTTLREGSNGWTCLPGHPGVVGDVAMCADQAAMQWAMDLMGHKDKPTNTQPGIIYMLAGGTDWSATDPWATSGKPIQEPPHWMIMWPFDPKTAGLPDQAKQTGTWIMWAGTPYAHLMINQKP
jgi:hypothetical protein